MQIPRTLALTSFAAVTLALTACAGAPESSNPEPSPSGHDHSASTDWCDVATGGAANEVSASGEFAEGVELAFEPGLSIERFERAVVESGDGATVGGDDWVSVSYAMYSANTGDRIMSEGYGDDYPVPLLMTEERVLEWMLDTVGCVEVGSRVVSVIPAGAAFGEEGIETPDFTVAGDEPLVLVVDVVRALDRAWGAEVEPAADLPAVEFAADGVPTVTIPDASPPAELNLGMLKQGDGPVVPEAATVLVHYHGVSWDTGEVFDSSWGRGAPAVFGLQQVVPGFAAAIAGQTVGSQVIVAMPPELAYGTDPEAHDLGGQTLVFVVDILSFV